MSKKLEVGMTDVQIYEEMKLGPVHRLEDGEFVLNKKHSFPLTRNEAEMLYNELQTHWFSRSNPHYHLSTGLMQRLGAFVEDK